jgi:predicted dehydrogenase
MRLVHDRTLWLGDQKIVEGKMTSYIDGDEGFDNQFREFASAIHEGRVPLASGQEVRPVVEVLAAALESAKMNRPINL